MRMQWALVLGCLAMMLSHAGAAVRVVGLGGGGAEMRALNADFDSYLDWASEQPELWRLKENLKDQLEEFVAADGLMLRLGGVSRANVVFVDSYDEAFFRPTVLTVLRSSLPQNVEGAISGYMKALFQARLAYLNGAVRPPENNEFAELEEALFSGLERYDRHQLHLETGAKLIWSAIRIRGAESWKLDLRGGLYDEISLLPNVYAALGVDFGEVELIDLEPAQAVDASIVMKVKWRSKDQLHSASLVTDIAMLGKRSVFRVLQKVSIDACESWATTRQESDLF